MLQKFQAGKIVDLTTLGEMVTHYHFGVADFQCDQIEFQTSRVICPKTLEI